MRSGFVGEYTRCDREKEMRSGKTRCSTLRILIVTTVLLSASAVFAQQLVQAQRRDGALTPLRVYSPSGSGCAPLAVISPGAGGSENGYKYLAQGMQADGWRAIVMGHKESGSAALRSDIRHARGIKRGLRNLV